jgi:hypothetical protein
MSQKRTVRISLRIALGLVFVGLFPSGLLAQTYFDSTVSGTGMPNYIHVAFISPPTNVGSNRKTVVRMIGLDSSNACKDLSAIDIQIVAGAGKTTANVTLAKTDVVTDTNTSAVVASPITAVKETSATTMCQLVEVAITYDDMYNFGMAPAQWDLQIKQQAQDTEYSLYLITAVGNQTTVSNMVHLPKIRPLPSTSPTLDFGSVQINLPVTRAPQQSFKLMNIGTGNLTFTGLPLNLQSPYSFVGAVVLAPLDFGGQVELKIQFLPTSLGLNSPTLAVINTNQPGPNTNVALQGAGITLDAVMLMDVSGSMGSFPGMDVPAPELQSRLWEAKQAAMQLYQEYTELTGGVPQSQARLGLYTFPDPKVTAPSAAKPIPIATSGGLSGQFSTATGTIELGGLAPFDGTPMAEGIKIAQADLNTGSDRRPAIIMLTDGGANVNSKYPDPPDPDSWIPQLVSKGIHMFTVGFGDPKFGDNEVDWNLLGRLGSQTKGAFLNADPTFAAKDGVKKAFRNALKDWIGLGNVLDPQSTINANQQKSHTVCIDSTATAIVFVVDWGQNETDAIRFSLQSPQGTIFNGSTYGVTQFKNTTYTMYVITGDQVRFGKAVGAWTLLLTGASDLGGPLAYAYNVQVQTVASIAPAFTANLATTAAYAIEVPIHGVPPEILQQSKVTLTLDAPAASFGTYLAKATVDPKLILNPTDGRTTTLAATAAVAAQKGGVPATLGGDPTTFAQRKYLALKNVLNQPFSAQRSTSTIQLFDDGTHGDRIAGDGIFTAAGPELRYDGIYNYQIGVAGLALGPSCFQRTATVSQYVALGFEPAALASSVQWQAVQASPFFDPKLTEILQTPPPAGTRRSMIVVTPQDRFGNSYAPGNAQRVKFNVSGASAISTTQDLLDGRYAVIVEIAQGSAPSATVSVEGTATAAIPESQGRLRLLLIILLIVLAIIVIFFLFFLVRRLAHA